MARDRQRAKQRKQRRLPQQSKRDDVARDEPERIDAAGPGDRHGEDEGLVPEPRSLHHENVPPAFDHGGEVEQFDAALVSGADGEPADTDADPADAFGGPRDDDSGLPDADAEPDPGLEPAAVGSGGGDGGGGAVVARVTGPELPAQGKGGSRFVNFLRASWAELQRVQWPDRRQVGQATAVVMGFVIVAGAFLGFADFVAQEIVDLII